MVESDKLIKFFDAEYYEEREADEIKKGIREDLKEFAKNNEVWSQRLFQVPMLCIRDIKVEKIPRRIVKITQSFPE